MTHSYFYATTNVIIAMIIMLIKEVIEVIDPDWESKTKYFIPTLNIYDYFVLTIKAITIGISSYYCLGSFNSTQYLRTNSHQI